MATCVAVTVVITATACESVQVDRVNNERAEQARPDLPTSASLTDGARAHSRTQCQARTAEPSDDPTADYGPEPAIALRDLVASAPLDPSDPDPGSRNGSATTLIWAEWEDEPTLTDPAWDAIGVGEHECDDGRLYMTLVLRDDPDAASCRGTAAVTSRNLAYRTVAGVNPNLLSLDLYEPVRPAACPPSPLVVYVHGGSFRTGDKANKIADKAALFTAEGWALASVNYRLSPNPPNDLPGQVRYPVHEQDVATAVSWLTANASNFDIDPTQIVLLGHSSGAYLVSLLSTDTSLLTAAGVDVANIRCTTSLDTEYDAAAQIALGGAQEILYRNALGNDPATWAAASPINHVADPGPHPDFQVFTQGSARRTNGSKAFAAALVAAGTPATALVVNQLTHEEINEAVGAPGDTLVTPPLLDFFRACVTGT